MFKKDGGHSVIQGELSAGAILERPPSSSEEAEEGLSMAWRRRQNKGASGSKEKTRHGESKDTRAGWRRWKGNIPPQEILGFKDENINEE